MSECLYEVLEPGIGLITFNRPDRLNAWTGRMGNEYFAAIDAANADPKVRVIVVTGAGKGYCAGADMGTLQAIPTGDTAKNDDGPSIVEGRMQDEITRLPKPVIAAVNGAAAGLGHAQRRRPGDQEGAGHIDGQNAVEALGGHFLPGLDAMHTRHVNEPVQASESLDGGLDHGLAACLVRHVHLLQQQVIGGVLMGVRIVQGPQIRRADSKALMQQVIHAGAANAASRASDENSPLFPVWHLMTPTRQQRAFN